MLLSSFNQKEKNGGYRLKSYIIDAVAFLAYLSDRLPAKADEIFKLAENKQVNLLLPSIALGETLYTIYKGKEIFGNEIPFEKIDLIFQILEEEDIIKLTDLDINAWRIFNGLNISELHDRMIVSSFHQNKASAILTKDTEITEKIPVIWD
jgi:predicted nucleic acid-binding protein